LREAVNQATPLHHVSLMLPAKRAISAIADERWS